METQETTAKIAEEVISWLREGKEFATEQAPELVEQIVTWGVVSGIYGFLGWGIVCAVCAWAVVYSRRQMKNEDLWVFGFGICSVLTCIMLVASLVSLERTLKALVAPNLYVLEKLSALVR